MGESGPYEEELHLEAGWLCLDFANTAEFHASDSPLEELNSYTDLVAWSQTVGLLTEDQAQRLLGESNRCPADATATLEWAITLREVIYRIFSAVAKGGWPQEDDLVALNAALSEALPRLQISLMADRFTWQWSGEENALDQMLWPVVRSAAELLTWEELDRVGECADDRGCGWLFIDMSKNRSRRYCGYSCSNRAKAQRHYSRKKAGRASDT